MIKTEMKPLNEILNMLVCELALHVNKLQSLNKTNNYYNDQLGNTSALLARVLELLMKNKPNDWEATKWMDDCLITNLVMQNGIFTICGIMIWGKRNTTRQWTDPFAFEIELLENGIGFRNLTFYFCDLDKQGISYEEFRSDRNYWTYSIRNWHYILSLDES